MDNLRLTIDLLPRGAWGNDLSKTLSKKDWDILRNECYKRAGCRCEICGKSNVQLNAHEVWDFDIVTKTQTLVAIVALCTSCHGVKHMRNSERLGYGDQAKAHFLNINKCNPLIFAGHYLTAKTRFNELNKIKRWKIVADLDKFGGKGIKVKQRELPLILNPYENIDWTTAKHIKTNQLNSIKIFPNLIIDAETIICTSSIKKLENSQEALYFVVRTTNKLPPKICSIEVDNYSGTITIVSDRVNKIQWLCENKIIETKYNFSEKFVNNFNVENLKCEQIRFKLIGDGGEIYSSEFQLIQA